MSTSHERVFADASPGRRLLVSDFDGTMTREDYFVRVMAEAPAGTMPDYWGRFLRGEITQFEALQGIFAHAPGEEREAQRIARDCELDPQAGAYAERLAQAGWDLVVVSAGCQWYIDYLLGLNQLELPVIANPGEFVPGHGIDMRRAAASPFDSPETGIDKAAVIRRAQQVYRDVAFAGDGRPDLTAARLVPASCRFARGWLAEALERERLPYRRFEHWSEAAQGLLQDWGG